MEASRKPQPTLDYAAPGGAARPRGRPRLIDPGSIDYGRRSGIVRLELMVNAVLERMTAVDEGASETMNSPGSTR